jgi:hypothetical protein
MKQAIKDQVLSLTDRYYRARNRRKRHILVYADSRGMNLYSRLGKTGHGTYVWRLRRKYHLTYALCPEKYTTLVDFIEFMKSHDAAAFDAVVCHCGIVDFSPRPMSSLGQLKGTKAGSGPFAELFSENETYHQNPFDEVYRGEHTINLYSEQYLSQHLLPQLSAIPRLIWVNSNRTAPGWNGNYHRGRPINLDQVISRFDAVMTAGIPTQVDLSSWSPQDTMRFTIDNVHYTSTGFERVAQLIDEAIQRLD